MRATIVGFLALLTLFVGVARYQTNGGTGSSLPLTCIIGSVFVHTGNGKVFICTATDTWSMDTANVIGLVKGANFNTTSDNTIPINAARYVIRKIVVTNTSASLTTAVGGVYTATSKG